MDAGDNARRLPAAGVPVSPLAALFGAGVALRNALYDRGFFAIHTLQWPVISIGNLSVGGSGKTPFTIALGKLLQERKLAFDVLSRGYKRQGSGLKLVEPKGSAAEFGDEPLLIARKLEVPVVVAADRVAAGLYAEKAFGDLRPAHGDTWFHLLDDGFQHRRLARAFDIVLMNAEDLDDDLLPSGRLREPPAALARADAIVISENIPPQQLASFHKPIWTVRRSLDVPTDRPARPVAFCGVARPQRFFDDLRQLGVELAATATFADHHAYTTADIDRLLSLKQQHSADGFVTTEKDAINLETHAAALQPCISVPLKLELLDAARHVDAMLATIQARRGRSVR